MKESDRKGGKEGVRERREEREEERDERERKKREKKRKEREFVGNRVCLKGFVYVREKRDRFYFGWSEREIF